MSGEDAKFVEYQIDRAGGRGEPTGMGGRWWRRRGVVVLVGGVGGGGGLRHREAC